jgi:hypothetical protein
MKPLTEIKKGCEKIFFRNNSFESYICGLKENDLCPTCQALLEQAQEFEKMILELQKLDLEKFGKTFQEI